MSLADRAAGRDVLEALAEHLAASGISVEEVGRISRLGGYQSIAKLRDVDGVDELVKSDLFKWEISPAFVDGPAWQPVDRGPAVKLPKRTPGTSAGEWTTAVVWPDTQIGYYRGIDGALVATHDEAAIDVALALTRSVRPDLVVRVGDDLDLPELGKYRTTPAFAATTQASIDRATLLAAQQRDAVGPDASVVYLAGNHEERLSNYVLDNARAAYGLRRGRFTDEPPAAWPVFSIPYLCRLDEFGVEYRPGFPASDVEIGADLRAVHGLHVTSRGQTAHKYLDREKTSVVYGHVHRREFAARTFLHNGESREIFAASPGCLARLDGAVPSTKGATDLDGRPLLGRPEDWQQGLGIVHFRPGAVAYENVAISSDGATRWAFYAGKTYESETR